ncbi:MAG TPA: helix-turn-helix domain-containing protein, partial [Propionibacteriaceae bacterium]|nr:helix-turn-helix domain-containing protein [Propionibacteriaceae bacterium]
MSSLEERVEALEQALTILTAAGAPSLDESGSDPQFWLLRELRNRYPAASVIFGGTAETPHGPVSWQWGVPTEQVGEQDWAPAASVLAALSHPVRLRLLQQVLNGTATTAELAEVETLGTTGQLHHHLRALVAAGWLTSIGRGRWGIPAPRVIPLLVVVVAAT